MSGFNYKKIAKVTSKYIKRYGTEGVLYATSMIVPGNPGTPGSGSTTVDPWETGGTTGAGSQGSSSSQGRPYPVKVVVVDYESKDVDGTLIRQTDQLALISVEGLGDYVISDADNISVGKKVPVTYGIVVIKPIRPAEDIILYQAQLRA